MPFLLVHASICQELLAKVTAVETYASQAQAAIPPLSSTITTLDTEVWH
jgi:hypothetical protein